MASQNGHHTPSPSPSGPPTGALTVAPSETRSHRERIVGRILARRAGGGMRRGIYGAEVCQRCGRLGTFSGFVPALAAHVGRFHEFVCARCFERAQLGRSAVSLMDARQEVAAALVAQPHRFCEVCRARVEEAGRQRLDEFWLCHKCSPQVRAQELRDLRRRRYLDIACPGEAQLRTFAVALEATRLDLEEIMAAPERQAGLRANRPQRAQAVLAGLETAP